MSDRCNICEAPAVMHIGAGPRCDACQYHDGPTLAALRAERDRIDRVIELRKRTGGARIEGIGQARPLYVGDGHPNVRRYEPEPEE